MAREIVMRQDSPAPRAQLGDELRAPAFRQSIARFNLKPCAASQIVGVGMPNFAQSSLEGPYMPATGSPA